MVSSSSSLSTSDRVATLADAEAVVTGRISFGAGDPCFSTSDTYEYLADPMSTTTIPKPFMKAIGVAKMMVEMAIIRTCFTLAAMLREGNVIVEKSAIVTTRKSLFTSHAGDANTYHNVRGDVNLLAIREEIFSEKDNIPLNTTTNMG